MLKQEAKARWRFNQIPLRFRRAALQRQRILPKLRQRLAPSARSRVAWPRCKVFLRRQFLRQVVLRMLFSDAFGPKLQDRRSIANRRHELNSILTDFRNAFPSIAFESDEKSRTVNAQAIVRGDARIVRLYGGLGFHPAIGSDGLVLVLLHEAGHHLATGGRLAFRSDVGCECAADRWALRRGRAELRRRTLRSIDLEKALADLDALSTSSDYRPIEDRQGPPDCWACDWKLRRLHLAGHTKMPAIRKCTLSEYLVS